MPVVAGPTQGLDCSLWRWEPPCCNRAGLDAPRVSAMPRQVRKKKEATRQQGGFFGWENSSNGGKAIRTFWLHTRSASRRSQELSNLPKIHFNYNNLRRKQEEEAKISLRLLFVFQLRFSAVFSAVFRRFPGRFPHSSAPRYTLESGSFFVADFFPRSSEMNSSSYIVEAGLPRTTR